VFGELAGPSFGKVKQPRCSANRIATALSAFRVETSFTRCSRSASTQWSKMRLPFAFCYRNITAALWCSSCQWSSLAMDFEGNQRVINLKLTGTGSGNKKPSFICLSDKTSSNSSCPGPGRLTRKTRMSPGGPRIRGLHGPFRSPPI
jgi:hypothetical protein